MRIRNGDMLNIILDSVAQLVEQYTFNVWVLGSNPSGITKQSEKQNESDDFLLFFF